MSGRDGDDEQGGFPDNIFRQMQAGHDKFMRELHEESKRFQQELENETKPSPSGGNFFVSFKDFINSNLDGLTKRFRSFPSNLAELRAKMQEERERKKQEELDIWRRWTGIEESPDHCQMLRDRASEEDRQEAKDAALMLLREARDRNAHVPSEKVEALFKDEGWSDKAAVFHSSNTYRQWLNIDWFKRSPYSPIALEQQSGLQQAGVTWRAAFEDLLNATLEKPMNSIEQRGYRPHGKVQSTRTGPGLDWWLSLQCRGILPPRLLTWRNNHHVRSSSARENIGRPVLTTSTDEVLERHAEHVITEYDLQQLVDEIATPALPTAAAAAADQGSINGDGGHEDYQLQVILREQQNKKRWLMARQEESAAGSKVPISAQREGGLSAGTKPRFDGSGYMTEQALYDQLEQLEPSAGGGTSRAQGLPEQQARSMTTPPPVPAIGLHMEAWMPTGNKDVDTYDAEDVLFGALEDGDIETAAQCLNRWHRTYGDVSVLIPDGLDTRAFNSSHEAPSTWYRALNEALSRGKLPDSDFWKQHIASYLDEPSERAGRLSLEEKREARELMRRGDQATGQTFPWAPYSMEDLRDMVERSEQERDALGLDAVDGKVETSSGFTPATTHLSAAHKDAPKVDVLSSLTTTHTTRLPDGTVTTKAVLKQRFADGREETEEKVHTYREPPAAQQHPKQPVEETKKGGWFWS